MSACVSRHGEFSEHTLDNSHTCTLCGVLDEEALRAELAQARSAIHIADATTGRRTAQRDQARAELERAQPVLDAVVRWREAFDDMDPLDPDYYTPDECGLAAAVDGWTAASNATEEFVELHLEPVTPDVMAIAAAATWHFPNPDIHAELVDDEPAASEAVRLPHAPCHETGEHQPHPWGDPSHWCDGSGEVS